MFESLIREAATRFNLGDNAGRFVRMLVDAIFDSGSGGFAGMRGRFADAGLGDLFASWIGTTPGDNVLQPDQFSTGFGADGSSSIASRLGIPNAAVNMAGAWLLPKVVGLLTRGGAIPTARPAEYDSWFAAPVRAAPAAAAASTSYASSAPAAAAASGGGWWKWLLGLIVLALLAFFGLRGCQQHDAAAPADEAATGALPADTAAPATDAGAMPADDTAATDAADAAAPPADAAATDGASTAPAADAAAAADANADPNAAAETALSNVKAGASTDDVLKALNLMIIHFDTGSANISSDSLEILGKAAEAIKAMPAGTKIEVGGHTDNTGNAAANQTLSQRRADAVVAKLGELGVAAGTLTGKGHGQDQPKADNGSEEGRAENRRIEFTVGK